MGWAKDVADLIMRNDHFRLNIHDAVRMREYDAMERRLVTAEQQLAASQAALRASTELLEAVPAYAWDDDTDWQQQLDKQIAANEAAMGGG